MAGVAIRLPQSGTSLSGWSAQLRVAASGLDAMVTRVAKRHLNAAVVDIRQASPVKTGRYAGWTGTRGWKLVIQPGLRFSVVTDPVDEKGRHYGEYVHFRGTNVPFWQAYAQPRVLSAYEDIKVDIRAELREMVRAGATASLAPTLSRSLAARGRLR